ncbi:DinB family protein [Deinococcus arcticus]|uniref:DinB-like domain-containing protein n=1 Tax=Deinococcus arcticus TaxID=2136176 RepID=A0A2T3W915_9DEIO|nr:DinB family protein [Deinococcus arcticus]PTA68390.1 hypothetical protein C8263_08125 [Deinococcus arcticus]
MKAPLSPHTRDELLAALDGAQAAWVDTVAALPLPDYFRAPAPGRWSPAEHLAHLALTHGRVAQGLGVPRPALRLLFGAPATARTYEGVRGAYQARLAAGGRAPARYVPRPVTAHDAATRDAQVAAYVTAATRVRSALAGWPEAALDRHALPHDLLGRLSARELLFFTVYHDHHHLRGALAAPETP